MRAAIGSTATVRNLATPILTRQVQSLRSFYNEPPIFFQNLEIDLPSIRHEPDLLNRGNMDAVNFLLAVAAILLPLGLAWLYINRK